MKSIMTITLFILIFFGCGQPTESKEILFVCTHGGARSPIATAFFNKIALEQDLNYHAVFRGTDPDEKLSKGTVVGLTNDGFEINDWKPKKVSANDIARAYKIVTFDCVLPSKNLKSNGEQWNGTPPPSKGFDEAKSVIKQKVEQLIDDLPK